jgi:hypothetical protein
MQMQVQEQALVRVVRVVCPECEETVAGVAQGTGYVVGRHPGADGKPCVGHRQQAQLATALAPSAAPTNERWLRLQVDRWNRQCPAGAAVAVRLEAGGPEYRAKTVSLAWAAEGCLVVAIAERSEPVPLERVRPLGEGEVLYAVPPAAVPPCEDVARLRRRR